jgi:hypothetical protein
MLKMFLLVIMAVLAFLVPFICLHSPGIVSFDGNSRCVRCSQDIALDDWGNWEMAEQNGIISNLGVPKRSATGIAAMGMIMKLDGSGGYIAMAAITVLAVAYMILDEVKDRRKNEQA